MMPEMRLTDAAVRFGGTLLNPDCHFDHVSIDSRKVSEGDLFVALIGERFDGHQFLPEAAKVASGLVVSVADKKLPLPQWVVEDTTQALGQLAQLRRESFGGAVIAITGSTGKTSVKEMTAAILRNWGSVHATAGNLNNHIGVPLTLLSMDEDAEVAVVEMGASASGEIEYLCSVAMPDIAVINNVQSSHIEGFGSVEAVAAAKGEIYSGLKPSGVALLNLDQPWCEQWQELIDERPCLTFSVNDNSADISASNIQIMDNGCYSFVLCVNLISGQPVLQQDIALSVPGLHAVNNALAASACALAAGADLQQIATGLAAVDPIAGRLQTRVLASGDCLIDDTYNASPSSFEAAIDVLANGSGRRVLIMGDMAELGNEASALHHQVGVYAQQAGIDALYGVGALTANACEAFGGKHFATKAALVEALELEFSSAGAGQGSVSYLVKGSRSAGMEQVVEMLTTRGEI